jgi:hypothetical protein
MSLRAISIFAYYAAFSRLIVDNTSSDNSNQWIELGAPTQEKQQHQDRDRDSQGPKQNPSNLPFFTVTHDNPPFLSDLEPF